jgi:hypothetical protein
MSENSLEQKRLSLKVTDAKLLLLITAISYSVAYNYEATYCSYFGILPDFVKLTPEVLVVSFLSIILLAFVIFWIINAAGFLVIKREGQKYPVLVGVRNVAVIILFVGITLGFVYGFSRDVLWAYFDILFVLVGIINCIYSYKQCRVAEAAFKKQKAIFEGKEIPEEKIQSPEEVAERINRLTFLVRRIDPEYIIIAYVFASLSLLSTFAGYREARNQTVFMEIPAKKLLVIRSYNDHFLCKSLKTNPDGIGEDIIGSELVVLNLDQITQTPLKSRYFKTSPVLEKVPN